jgi:hypothetical protein
MPTGYDVEEDAARPSNVTSPVPGMRSGRGPRTTARWRPVMADAVIAPGGPEARARAGRVDLPPRARNRSAGLELAASTARTDRAGIGRGRSDPRSPEQSRTRAGRFRVATSCSSARDRASVSRRQAPRNRWRDLWRQAAAAGIGGDRTPIERGHHGRPRPVQTGAIRATLCPHRGPPLIRSKSLRHNNFESFRARAPAW